MTDRPIRTDDHARSLGCTSGPAPRLRWRVGEQQLLDNSTQRAELERLARLAEQHHLQPELLDELVHDLAEEQATDRVNAGEADDPRQDADAFYGRLSADASAINNGGLRSQLAFLIDQRGLAWAQDQVERLIRPRNVAMLIAELEEVVDKGLEVWVADERDPGGLVPVIGLRLVDNHPPTPGHPRRFIQLATGASGTATVGG